LQGQRGIEMGERTVMVPAGRGQRAQRVFGVGHVERQIAGMRAHGGKPGHQQRFAAIGLTGADQARAAVRHDHGRRHAGGLDVGIGSQRIEQRQGRRAVVLVIGGRGHVEPLLQAALRSWLGCRLGDCRGDRDENREQRCRSQAQSRSPWPFTSIYMRNTMKQ
jgi:hypothetical protein